MKPKKHKKMIHEFQPSSTTEEQIVEKLKPKKTKKIV